MRTVADLIRNWVPRRYVALGTDGFGRSDTRERLRDFFEVDRRHVAVAALKALADEGAVDANIVQQAIEKYAIGADRPNPWESKCGSGRPGLCVLSDRSARHYVDMTT